MPDQQAKPNEIGRWPANLIHDGSDEVLAAFPREAGAQAPVTVRNGDKFRGTYGAFAGNIDEQGSTFQGDTGSAARFFKECRFTEDELCQSYNGLHANSAASQSGSCETSTAAGHAETKSLDFRNAESQATPGCTGNSENCTPIHSPVSAAPQESIDITPTTASHSKSNGFAPPATDASTNLDSAAAEAAVNVQVRGTRFRYCPKAAREDRNAGLDHLPQREVSYMNTHGGNADKGETWHPIDERTGAPRDRFSAKSANHHPTVKPTDLMRYLCRLVTPPGGLILDPFAGSGSTGKAAAFEGFRFLGIELDPEYAEIAEARIRGVAPLFAQEAAP